MTEDDTPLEWVATISHHNAHWATLLARLPAGENYHAEVLTGDSLNRSFAWHLDALQRLAGRLAQALRERNPHHPGAKRAFDGINIACRWATSCPQRDGNDGVNCGPMACLLLGDFARDPVSVWMLLEHGTGTLSFTGEEARAHAKGYLRRRD